MGEVGIGEKKHPEMVWETSIKSSLLLNLLWSLLFQVKRVTRETQITRPFSLNKITNLEVRRRAENSSSFGQREGFGWPMISNSSEVWRSMLESGTSIVREVPFPYPFLQACSSSRSRILLGIRIIMEECSKRTHRGRGFKGLVFVRRSERVRLLWCSFLGNFQEMFFLNLGPGLVATVCWSFGIGRIYWGWVRFGHLVFHAIFGPSKRVASSVN